jgi:glycosyltransferase involved in cell wall biosynthesis
MSNSVQHPKVSIVVTTKNEETNIGNCLRSIELQDYPNLEICVVDNFSSDKTVEIARTFTENIALRGPERSAQRNFGLTELASGEILGFIDADMILGPLVVRTAVTTLQAGDVGAYIDEVVLGTTRLSRIRRFERSFYSGTVIDCARFFTTSAFIKTGGFDESLTGPEDWDFDKRLRALGRVSLVPNAESSDLSGWPFNEMIHANGVKRFLSNQIAHNEAQQSLRGYFQKKNYYGTGVAKYAKKWPKNDGDVRKQLGARYRLIGVFVEGGRWASCAKNPLLTIQMVLLRMLTGFSLLRSKLARKIS